MPESFVPDNIQLQSIYIGIESATEKSAERIRITAQAKLIYKGSSGSTLEKEEFFVKYFDELPSNIQNLLSRFRDYCESGLKQKAGIE